MALVNNQTKEESPGIGIRKSKSLLLSGTSLASVESLSMPLTESVVVNLLEKKVTLTCRYANVGKASSQQVAAIYRNPFGKVAMIKRIFRSSRR
ncbi:hypothetical protein CFP56_024289 [Quercus suber]|uniref:Uncharacterized protein n=1 Tax=Quercus suber TaxID=58331 RepID=A0AAW0MC61_QUESU